MIYITKYTKPKNNSSYGITSNISPSITSNAAITIDNALSSTSSNPVENRAIYNALLSYINSIVNDDRTLVIGRSGQTVSIDSNTWKFDENGHLIYNGITDVNKLIANDLQATSGSITSLSGSNINYGDAVFENLTVTKTAHFFELIIDQIKSSQGQIIITPANATIDKVVTLSNGNFKCYFRATDGEDEIYQNFKADDQIVCQTFNAATGTTYDASNKFYWRLCTQVSTATEQTDIDGQNVDCHWIILSNTDKDSQSNSVPESGDNIVMLGNRTDATRQAAITIGAYNNPYLDATIKAPFIIQYNGINDYNLASHRLNVISNGNNQFKGKFSTNTGDDIEQLIDDVGEGVFTYMHVAYSNSATDWSKSYNKEYSYVGFCSNHTESDSDLTYNDYTWSLLKGRDGNSFAILETDYRYTQAQIDEYSANGYTGSWVVPSTAGINDGQYVNLKMFNTTKQCDTFIVAEVIRVEATTNVRCKSIGVYESGSNGRDGRDGTSISISATEVKYSSVFTAAQPNDSTFTLNAVPTVPQGGYLWTRTKITYSDGVIVTSYTSSYQGINGTNGADGTSVTITDYSTKYAVTQVQVQPADSAFIYESIPSLSQGDFLWVMNTTTYSDGVITKSYSVSRIGTDGAQGLKGDNSYLHIAYANSADGSLNFSLTYFANALYIGTYTDNLEEDSTNYSTYVWARLKGTDGRDGKDGENGKDGKDGENGTDGASMVLIETNYEITEKTLIAWAVYGEVGGWTIVNTPNLKVGQFVTLIVTNTTKNCKAYIIGQITSIVSNTRINMKCLGYYENGADGQKGQDGLSFAILITNYSYTQAQINEYSTNGYTGSWVVESTSGRKAGEFVSLRMWNSTKKCYSFIVAEILAVQAATNVSCKSIGLYESGANGANGTNGIDAEYYKLMPIREKAPIDKNGVLGINLAYNIVKVKGLTYTNISATTSTYYVRAKVTKESQLEPSTFNLSVNTETPSYTNSNYQNWKTSVTKVQYITVELVDANGNVKDKRIVYPELTASASFEITDQITSTVQGNYQDLNGKITTNTNSISTLNQKYDQISSTVESHTTKINNLDNEIEEQSTDISNLTQRADSISSQVSKYSGVQLINLFGWTKADFSQASYDNSDQSYSIVKAVYNGHDYYDVYSNVVQLQQGETYTFSFYTEFNPNVSVAYSSSNKLPVEFNTYITKTRKDYADDTYLDNPRVAYTFTATNDGYYVIDVGYQDHEEYKSFYRPQLELGDKPTQFDINNQMLSSQIVQTANNILLQVSNCGINIDQRQITLNGQTVVNGNLTLNDANQGFLLEGNGGRTLISSQSIGTYNDFIQKTAIAQSVSLSNSEPLVKTVESSTTYYTASFRFEKEFGFAKSGSTITVTNESYNFNNNGNLTQYTVTSKQYMVRENDVYKGLLTVGEPFTISSDSTIKIVTNLSVRFAKVNDEKQYVTSTLNYSINIPINDAFTLIGFNGLGCNFANNKTVYIGSEGTYIKYGNAGFKITNNSVKKMNSDGVWVNLDTKEIKILPDSNYTLQDDDEMLISNSTMTANRTLFLPATTYKGRTIYLKDYSQSEIIVNCPYKLISSNSYSASSTINVNNSANMFVYDGNYWLQFKCE